MSCHFRFFKFYGLQCIYYYCTNRIQSRPFYIILMFKPYHQLIFHFLNSFLFLNLPNCNQAFFAMLYLKLNTCFSFIDHLARLMLYLFILFNFFQILYNGLGFYIIFSFTIIKLLFHNNLLNCEMRY